MAVSERKYLERCSGRSGHHLTAVAAPEHRDAGAGSAAAGLSAGQPSAVGSDRSACDEDNNIVAPTLDSNGNVLNAGDSVTLIKDLIVKGGGFSASRGTLVKNLVLTSNPKHVEGRVNGTIIVLVAAFLKKANRHRHPDHGISSSAKIGR